MLAGELGLGDMIESLVTPKVTSPSVVLCSPVMPGIVRPVLDAMSGIVLAACAALPASIPTLRAEAAPMAIHPLVSMICVLSWCEEPGMVPPDIHQSGCRT